MGEPGHDAQGDDVGEEGLATGFNGGVGDGEIDAAGTAVFHTVDEEAVGDDEAVGRGVVREFIRRLLTHDQEGLGPRNPAEMDGGIGEDDLGFRRAAPRLGAIGLRLNGHLAV